MAESLESKKHPASELRRRKASEKGSFPRSKEWGFALCWLIGMSILSWSGPTSGGQLKRLMTDRFTAQGLELQTSQNLPPLFTQTLLQIGQAIVPFVIGLFLVGMSVHFAQAGFRWMPELLAPQWERLALGRGYQGWGTVVYASLSGLVRLLGVLACVGWSLWSRRSEFPSWVESELPIAINSVWRLLLGVGWNLGLFWLVVAAVDYGWNWWCHEQSLRMTDSELREELKESQGDPALRNRRRRLLSGG